MNNDTILKLVSFAWAGFGVSFGPIILLSLFWRKITAKGALWGMLVGAITVIVWGNIEALSDTLYEIVPGFLLCLVVTVLISLMTYRPNAEIEKEFTDTVEMLKREG